MKVNIGLNETLSAFIVGSFCSPGSFGTIWQNFVRPGPALVDFSALCRDPVHMSKLIEEARVRKEKK